MIPREGLHTQAELRLSRFLNHNEKDGKEWRLYVKDKSSRLLVLEVDLSNDDLANLLSSSLAHCDATWRGTERIGWEHQVKEEKGVTKKNLHEFEVDGWVARKSDIGNHHRRDPKTGTYSVSFTRQVPPEDWEDDRLREAFPGHGMLPDGHEAEELRKLWKEFCEDSEGAYEMDSLIYEIEEYKKKFDAVDARDSLAFVETLGDLYEKAKAWAKQGARSKWSTKPSLALWDAVKALRSKE